MHKRISNLVRTSMGALSAAAAHVGELARIGQHPRAIAQAARVADHALNVVAQLAEIYPDEAAGHNWDSTLIDASRDLLGAKLRIQHRWLQAVEPVSGMEHAAARVAFRVTRDVSTRISGLRAQPAAPELLSGFGGFR